MLPPEATNLFQEIAHDEMFRAQQQLDDILRATMAEMAARRMARSGNAMAALVKNGKDSMKARGEVLLSQLVCCLVIHNALTEDAISEATALLKNAIEMEGQIVRSRVFGNSLFADPQLKAATQQLQIEFGQEIPRIANRLGSEIKLRVAANKNAGSAAGPSYTFYGSVGVVQSGTGNNATVHQTVDASVKAQISSVLRTMLQQVDKPENNSIPNREELREVIHDVKAELEKPKSNILKLKSGLQTIAEAAGAIGALRSAYEALKPLLVSVWTYLA
jgi:hypothetical protein